jgi:hypothetical protein
MCNKNKIKGMEIGGTSYSPPVKLKVIMKPTQVRTTFGDAERSECIVLPGFCHCFSANHSLKPFNKPFGPEDFDRAQSRASRSKDSG